MNLLRDDTAEEKTSVLGDTVRKSSKTENQRECRWRKNRTSDYNTTTKGVNITGI